MASMFRQPFGHWSTLVEGLQASPQECYAAIEEAIRRREIPEARTSRVTFHEGGVLSAERIYLRVGRKQLGFDICAAPFGNGFFFSRWQGELPPSNFLAASWCASPPPISYSSPGLDVNPPSVHLPISVSKGAKPWASRRWRVTGTA